MHNEIIQYESSKKEDVIKVEKALLTAMKNCDVKKLDELLHEELLFNIPNGQTVTKTMDLDTYSSGNMKIDDIKSSELKINFIEDNAVVSVILDIKGKYFDYPLDGKYKIIRTWKLINSNFKVISGSSIKLEENNN